MQNIGIFLDGLEQTLRPHGLPGVYGLLSADGVTDSTEYRWAKERF